NWESSKNVLFCPKSDRLAKESDYIRRIPGSKTLLLASQHYEMKHLGEMRRSGGRVVAEKGTDWA
ncbi:MAG: hypothetical protein WA485_01610, partial [Candidatus Sulfotelmatobacter sp.]